MALSTYGIVAIFVSILGSALIISITWLVYKWSTSGRSSRQSQGWPFSHSTGTTGANLEQPGSPGHFPPTQRLMVQHGRVVPLRHSTAPSFHSGISSIHYNGWLASGRSVTQASSMGDAASIHSAGTSNISSRAGRRTPSIDLEAGGVSYTDTNDLAPDAPPVHLSPVPPTFPHSRNAPRLYSQLRSKRFRAPSLRSHRSSVPAVTRDNDHSGPMTSLTKSAQWSTIMEESSPSASGQTSSFNSRPVSTAFPKSSPTQYSSPKQQGPHLAAPISDKRRSGSSSIRSTNPDRRTRLFGAAFFDTPEAPDDASIESLAVHPSTASDSSPHIHAVPSAPAASAVAPIPPAIQVQMQRYPSTLHSRFHVPPASIQQKGPSTSDLDGFNFGLDSSKASGAETSNDVHTQASAGMRSNTMGSEDSELLSALPRSPSFGKFSSSAA